ncbi:MAG: succinate dehydrogenase assembly factor 2 [Oceanococcaceae bacterium]
MNPGQLRWRCRRGMRELDRAFLHVLEREYPDRDADFQSRFVAFTEEPDPDILAMLSGRAVAPPEYADIVELMRHCGAFPAVSN